MLSLIVQSAATGLFMLLILLAAQRGSGALAGLLTTAPIIFLVAFWFVARAGGTPALRAASSGAMKAMPGSFLFLIVVYFLAGRVSPLVAMLAGLVAWGAIAALTLAG